MMADRDSLAQSLPLPLPRNVRRCEVIHAFPGVLVFRPAFRAKSTQSLDSPLLLYKYRIDGVIYKLRAKLEGVVPLVTQERLFDPLSSRISSGRFSMQGAPLQLPLVLHKMPCLSS